MAVDFFGNSHIPQDSTEPCLKLLHSDLSDEAPHAGNAFVHTILCLDVGLVSRLSNGPYGASYGFSLWGLTGDVH